MNTWKPLFYGILLVILLPGVQAAEFTVNPGDSIQAAIDAATAGDTIIVNSGTYNEEIEIDKQLTLTGSGWPVIDGTGGITDAVRIVTDNVVFEGFEVRNAVASGIYVRLNNNTVVRNNRVSLSGYNTGIYVRGSDGTIISNNTIENNPAGGIWILDTTGSRIFNNTCTGNADGGFPGILLEDSSGNELYYNDLDNYCEIGSGFYSNAAESGSTPSTNRWYNETLGRGNWYSDYDGSDADSDGIGDTAYDIYVPEGPVINTDIYPLMPVGPVPAPAPTITVISVSGVTNESATIGWTIGNGVNSNNRVLYGTDSNLVGAEWSAWDNATTGPSIAISGLLADTTYYYRCYAERADDADRSTTSGTGSFATLANPGVVITVDDDNAEVPGGSADYANLTDALAAAIDGDEIVVYPGTYAGNHLVDHEINVTGIGMPVLVGLSEDALDEAGDVVAIAADDVVFEGFAIREGYWSHPGYSRSPTIAAGIRIGTATYSSGWSTPGSADWVTVRDCTIDGATRGIYVNQYSGNAVIEGCTINGTYDGIVLDQATDAAVTDCVVTDATRYGIVVQKKVSGLDPVSTRNTITNTTLDDEGNAWGIVLDRVSDNTIESAHLSGANTIDVEGDRNQILTTTIEGPCEYHRGGIHIVDGDDIVLAGNAVSHQTYGIWIEPSARRVTMHGNQMAENTYNFGFGNDWTYAPTSPPTHTITTDNTLDGLPLYYIIGETGVVLDYTTLDPAPGYLALIDCREMTVSDFYLEKNVQGFFLYNVSDSVIEGVTAHGNAENGIFCFDVDGLSFSGVFVDSNGRSDSYRPAGIYFEEATGCTIEGAEVTANVDTGIELYYSCGDITIRDTAITNNGDPASPGSGKGITTESMEGLTVTGCTIANTLLDIQGTGIETHASTALIYDNIFDNTATNAKSWNAGVLWNVTPTLGENVLGYAWVAGNAWSDYTGADTNSDGLGDTDVPHTSSGGILNSGGDFHPLINAGPAPEPTTTPTPEPTAEPTAEPTMEPTEEPTAEPTPKPTAEPAGDTGDPPLPEQPPEREPVFTITILSPEEGRTTDRGMPVRYTTPVSISRAWYRLDDGPDSIVPAGSEVRLDRLVLGRHTLTVTGMDTLGRLGSGSVDFEVIPLALGGEEAGGTPDYPDETVYGFLGRQVDYTLSFEGTGIEADEIRVYINRHLAGVIGEDAVLVSSLDAGGLIGTPDASAGLRRYSMRIPAGYVVPSAENLISFIHARNPSNQTAGDTWQVSDVAVTPDLPVSFPSIRIFTDDRALSPGDDLMAWTEIYGVAPDDAYEATVYVVDSRGTVYAFPGGGADPAPLDSSLVAANYYGRIPGALTVTDGMAPGTYRLCADLERSSDGRLVAFGSTNLFISSDPAVKVYMDREWYGEGMRVTADCAVVTGEGGEDASLVLWLESPDGTIVPLPTQELAGNCYLHVLNRVVDGTWDEGTYVLRALLYGGDGNVLATDFAAFEVSLSQTDLVVQVGPDTVQSRIVLFDGGTFTTVAEKTTRELHDAVSFQVRPGTYWIGGETVAGDGTVRLIPVSLANSVLVHPGDPVTVAIGAVPAAWGVIA